MVKIFVIDNGGQWTHREWRTLKYLDAETKIIPNTSNFDDILHKKPDGFVLSGGAPRIGLEEKLGNTDDVLKKANIPILGICAGHQYMARFFGGKVKPSEIPEFGKVELTLLKEDVLFNGLAKKSIAWASHNDEVEKIPDCFDNLASSKDCRVQAMKHKEKTLYGLQFHPEVEHTEYGELIFKNFIEICEKK